MALSVSAFYKFVAVTDLADLRQKLFDALAERGMKGTILLAGEGINGTISGTPEAMAEFLGLLRADARFADLVTKDATTEAHPFKRLKVKIKPEILSFGHPEADPTVRAGTYVAPAEWNALIADPEVLVVDTRNTYEVAAGTFVGAIDPGTRSFGEFPAFVAKNLDPAKHTKIAMFCTGGIRCEKASAYLKAHGFDEVYHLKGGILNYLAQVPASESQWQGECFVFDERVGVKAE
jgi:UPF0176 protein